ncbi:leucine-rich repeat LGI family member 4-like [Aphelocoma coerulescens]|uniref:leucine-rich repeat LGI family member 4-like n=1 Tax=Aphelocoma coerulescens TaxID=39617 RepID=UPI0036049349
MTPGTAPSQFHQGSSGCPGGCDCDRDSAWCRGGGGGGVPKGLPPRLATLSLIRWDIEGAARGELPANPGADPAVTQIPSPPPSLVTSGRLGSIGDGAFAGLGALEYLFIEDTELGAIAPTALRGLRGLLFLSLANNRLESLPRGLFQDLGTLTQLDLRGNPFRCDCRLRWLLRWMGTRPSPTPPEGGGRCRAPLPHQGTPLALLSPRQLQCHRHELRPFQSLPFSSLGAEPFALGGHPGVALAQPAAGGCALLEWDQLGGAGRFRAPTVINSSSPVACHPLPVGDTLLVVVAQLGGGSWVWRRSGGPGSAFVRHQALGSGHLRRPHAVAAARLGGHLYLGVADSSKGGTSTVFRWASGGFYPHQTLRPWHRDTHLEFLELGGRPALVVCSGQRRPLVYRWSGGSFAPHTDIPHVPDVYAAKHFRVRGSVFLCLTRFLGDAKVMRWEGSMFREVQQVPARGSLVFQPLTLGGHRYVLLGNDFAPSRVFRLGPGGHLEPAQDLPAPTPRAFVPVTVGQRHFLVASSFKGATQIYCHVTEDIGT